MKTNFSQCRDGDFKTLAVSMLYIKFSKHKLISSNIKFQIVKLTVILLYLNGITEN